MSEQQMVRMISLGYPLLMSLSILSQGFLFSVSKSIRKAENEDMLLDKITLRKAYQTGDASEKVMGSPLESYKMDSGNVLNEEERSLKSMGTQNNFFNRDGLPLSIGIKQLPYLALKNSVHPPEAEDQSIELAQERRDIGEDENAAKFPVGRRDFDMLRCMLGRVYRPCWQI
ncbi:pro-MCH [Pelobates cultripes]|uniref:Pro-MCH n=2 Tax=Pelobates cultripes TaxID=61616 RepID=A0AAD1W147_PELCU|nr:pro-MCH [Pelobates cultripes]